MTLLRDLINIPETVTAGDLVMELASGIEHVEQTVGDYVVTGSTMRWDRGHQQPRRAEPHDVPLHVVTSCYVREAG